MNQTENAAPAEVDTTPCGATADNDPAPCVLPERHAGRHQDAEGLPWRHGHKYGRPELYEITWMSGHIETVTAHQVTYPHAGMALFGGGIHGGLGSDNGGPRVQMHAELDGHWVLTLSAREEDIRTIRNVTRGEQIPGVAA